MNRVQTRLASAFALVTLITAVYAGCSASSPRTVTVQESDDGTTVHLQRGDMLTVRLDGNPTTGYRWDVASIDGTVLEQQGEPEYKAAEQGKVGGGGEFTFRLKAKAAGASELKIVYHRPWEADTAPLSTYVLNVTVE